MMGQVFAATLRQELALARAAGWASAVALLFYVACAMLTPFALGPDGVLLARVAGGMAWIAALLAMLLSLDRLFQPDAEDGTLDQWLVGRVPLLALALGKIVAHWLTTAVPLIVATPLVAVLLALPPGQFGQLALSLALGTPALSAIGAACAALGLAVRRGTLLIALLVLPLCVPVLIFGVATLDPARGASALRLLAAISLAALALAPLAIAAALRDAAGQ